MKHLLKQNSFKYENLTTSLQSYANQVSANYAKYLEKLVKKSRP